MNRTKCILLCMFTMLLFTSVAWGKSKVDSIQGIWKCEVRSDKGYTSILEIGKDYIIFDGEREIGLILEEKEGVVLIRKAGLQDAFARIVMRDDDHILMEIFGGKIAFVRSSIEEMRTIVKPPVENIIGLYRDQNGKIEVEISDNTVIKNGVQLDVSLIGEDQMYFALDGNNIQFGLTPIEKGILVYREGPGEFPVTLFKVAPQEAGTNLENEAAEQDKTSLKNPAILQSRVEFSDFSASVPGPGGSMQLLKFDMILEIHYLPEEKRTGTTRPTQAQFEAFRNRVIQLEANIRDHMNTFLTGQSATNLMGDRGPELVKAEVMRFVNGELGKHDFEAQMIPETISRKRVTNVLLPLWMLI